MSTGPTTLYRFHDADGQLLYVGVTMALFRRIMNHRAKPWWEEVAGASFEHFETRGEALLAELIAVARENPRYNAADGGPSAKRLDGTVQRIPRKRVVTPNGIRYVDDDAEPTQGAAA